MNYDVIFSRIFESSKDRFIDNADLNEDEKEFFKEFFDTHTELHSKINWQNPAELTLENFQKVYNASLQTDSYRRKMEKLNPKSYFSNPDMFEIIAENDDWLFVFVKTYEAAKFCNSYRCGGIGAKWCIGWSKGTESWDKYTKNNEFRFVLAFNKDPSKVSNADNRGDIIIYDKKYMLQIGAHMGKAWIEADEIDYCIPSKKWPAKFGISYDDLKNELIGRGYDISPEKVIVNSGMVEDSEFEDDENIEEVTLTDKVKSISDYAFRNCRNLKYIKIPSSVTSIGEYAFELCESLEGIEFEDDSYYWFAHGEGDDIDISDPKKNVMMFTDLDNGFCSYRWYRGNKR